MPGAAGTDRPLLVLWDVDHTLIENSGVSKEVYLAAFEVLTGRPAEHQPDTEGRTDPEIMRNMLADHGLPVTEEYEDRLFDVLEQALASKKPRLQRLGHALPGAGEVIVALREVPGVVQSVLTGNIQPNAFTKVSAFGLHEHLDFEVGGYGSDDIIRANLVAVAQKRAGAKYGAVLDRSNTVLIGDTPRDVEAGKRGGARVVAVASGPYDVDELEGAGADMVLADLTDTACVVKAVMATADHRSP
jgi:phosphoglycolate phosphatase-like HAD superfamily hydrolase